MKNAPALVVFCREPVAGHAKTRLASYLAPADIAALANAFILDTLAKASAMNPSQLIIAGTGPVAADESAYFRRLARRFGARLIDQGQGGLGIRMARSLEPFCTGSGALLIGTDVPSLPFSALRTLCELVRRRRLVFGPSLDGGYYAIGVRGPLPPILTGIRWSTSSVLDRSVMRARRLGRSVSLGQVWHDVDRWGDLKLLCTSLARFESEGSSAPHPCPKSAAVLRRLGLLPRRR